MGKKLHGLLLDEEKKMIGMHKKFHPAAKMASFCD